TVRVLVFFLLSATMLAQEPSLFGPPPNKEAPAPGLSFERIQQANKEPQNWLTYSGSLSSQRHSLLTEIQPGNARDLELKWVFQSRSLDRHQVTPLVVNGTMYTIQSPNDVVALNAATGKQIWIYSHIPDQAARNCCGRFSRGVAIAGDTVFLASFDARIIAIDARTGKERWKTPPAGDPKQGYAFTHAPLIVKDKIIAGTAGGEFGVRGFIAAWDLNTGKEVWRFNTVPGPGEPGNETWSGDSWRNGGAPVWVTGSYDPESNLMYWGTGNPGPDWDGAGRLGDNLYSCSVIALDPDTGTLKWHYQFSPHNEFDWDSAQIPVLADLEWQGKPRKVMLWANRNGIFYVLDRTTGEFLKGQPFVKVNWVDGFDPKGRPIPVPGMAPSREGTLIYPGNQGGTNWYSPSYSPRTGLFYVPTWENTSTTYLKGDKPPEFIEGRGFTGIFPRPGSTTDDVHSSIQAIDPKTGQKRWTHRLAAPSTETGVLTTASDVLFSGGRDGAFFALDARSGKLLWQTNLGPSVAAGPMTYAVNGKQYVSVMAGNSMFTFGLRER
ncbi:MAG TPA: PQQ-dependent dehydrogenase, methanol/ethanol family, partial [Vicinamibacterales bacterium]|nr:PQQ-dependent dehydrogenase, methanol/ethanol family [Vicinamibacterales bacterium]